MDDYNDQSAQSYPDSTRTGSTGTSSTGSAARMISQKAAETKDKVTDLGRRAADKIDSSRESAAGALDKTASSLHSGGDQLSGVAHSAADKLQATADYVRQTDLRGMANDVEDLVKRYPGQALAVAAVLGFLVARGLRSSD